MALPARAAQNPAPDAAGITYQFQVIEMNGVGWREPVYGRLQPVARRGSATVWTTSRAVAQAILKGADKVIQAPRVTATDNSVAHVSMRSPESFVSEVLRHEADDSVRRASLVVNSVRREEVRTGFSASLVGRRLDQGVLARVVLEETQLVAVHRAKVGREANSGENQPEELPSGFVMVPEVASIEVAGEWLIPKQGALVVSLGAHTMADASGKAVVRERLVLLDARPADAGVSAERRPTTWQKVPGAVAPAAQAVAEPPSPSWCGNELYDRVLYERRTSPQRVAVMPALPSRSLPQPHDQNGPIALPPLPPEPPSPTTLPGSSDPCATPQSRPAAEPKRVDPDSVKAGLRQEKNQDPPLPVSIDEDGNLTIALTFRTKLSGCSAPSRRAIRQAAVVLMKSLKLKELTARSAPAEPSTGGFHSSPSAARKNPAQTAPANTPSAERSTEPAGDESSSPFGGVWTPLDPNTLRIPLNGMTIELRLSPSTR